jgi:hypothetical protein
MASLRDRFMSRRTLKLVAVGYLVKTLIVAVVWVLVPDLPRLVRARVQAAWAAVSGTAPD